MRNSKSKKRTNQDKQSETLDRGTKLDLNLHECPPINFRKIQKSGFRIGAHVDIGMKDFEAGMTFGKNNIHEIKFSENNNHLKLLKSLENEESTNNNSKEKDKIINTLMSKLTRKDTPQSGGAPLVLRPSVDETRVKPSSSESTE